MGFRRRSLLALGLVAGICLGAAPAHADSVESFQATGSARALHLSLLGKDVTFGVTGANVGATVGSTLSAVANAAGQLLQPGSSSSVSLSRDNSSAADPADGVQRCALPALPQPIASLLTANVACSLTKADIAAAAPHALGQASVLSLSLQANSVLKTITDQVQLGNTVSKVTDALQPVFDAVSQATGQQVNLDPASTVTDLLNALTTQQTLVVDIGKSVSELSTITGNVTSAASAAGGQIKILPVAALGGTPLATITIGSAKTSAVYDRAKGVSTASFDPSLVTVQIGSIAGLPGLTETVAPGKTLTLFAGTPLESTISVADGHIEQSGNSAKAVADGVSLHLLKGLTAPTSAGATTAAVDPAGAVDLELAHAESSVQGAPAVVTSPPAVNSPTAPPAQVKSLALTGSSPWLPACGMALLLAALGALRLRRNSLASNR